MREVRDAHAGQGVVSTGVMFGMRMMIGKDANAAEEAGEDHVETGGIGGASGEQIRGDDAEGGTEFEDIPERLAQDGDGGIFALKRVALAREGLDQGGLAATVGAEDADVFANRDAKGEAVEGDVLTAKNSDVLQVEERGSHRREFTLGGWKAEGGLRVLENGQMAESSGADAQFLSAVMSELKELCENQPTMPSVAKATLNLRQLRHG